jgi:hypothetical protein
MGNGHRYNQLGRSAAKDDVRLHIGHRHFDSDRFVVEVLGIPDGPLSPVGVQARSA